MNVPLNTTAIVGAHPDHTDFRRLVDLFAGSHADHYARSFLRIGDAAGLPATFNMAAALLGPVWMAARRLWGWFWIVVFLDLLGAVQIGRGLWGNLGGDDARRAASLSARAAARMDAAQQAVAAHAPDAEQMLAAAKSFAAVAERAQQSAAQAASSAVTLVLVGASIVIVSRLAAALMGDMVLERRFTHWRSDRTLGSGLSWAGGLAGALFEVAACMLCLLRFTAAEPPGWLMHPPAQPAWRTGVADAIKSVVEALARHGDSVFGAVAGLITVVLDAFEAVLVQSPWPVVTAAILALALQLAGARVAIFTAVGLAYLMLLGFWDKSMMTIALLGTAAGLSILIGIPIGLWCGKSRKAFAGIRPILDFMQTMPAFVYLIPVISFFGIGKPPGIVATLVFGTPPVIRLTALGLQQVPSSLREAAEAFGASPAFVLFKVDVPVAWPSIMAGINQSILMCLSMVVIASLIGAKGLGEDVLTALQYAAEGDGILAGGAILICAIVLDRLVQGRGTVRSP